MEWQGSLLKNFSRRAIMILASWFLFSSHGLAQKRVEDAPQPFPVQVGVPYSKARKTLLRAGWIMRKNMQLDKCLGGLFDRRCYLYPEIGACAKTGLGLCRFNWISPLGKNYAVITQGGNPDGDPGNVSDWFTTE